MSAEPILLHIAKLLRKHGLEAILIGNAAAALQGAPVTTVDLDFLIRKTPANRRKLKALSDDLDAMLLRPFYPTSGLVRLMRDQDTLQLDFFADTQKFESARSTSIEFQPNAIGSISQSAIPPSKRSTKAQRLAALKRESERAELEQIRHHLSLPVSKRMNFLRKRVGLTATCL